MDKDYLLNDSKVFCMAPWISIFSDTNGKMRPCCISNGEYTLGNVSDMSYHEAFNSPKMKELRLDMLNEKENPICRRCNISEQHGVRNSFKEYFNKHHANKFEVVESTSVDGEVAPENITYLDIRFSNKCNFKCVMCGVHASSSWAPEHNKLNDRNIIAIIKPDIDTNDFNEYIDELIPNLEQITFAGGEPLFMDEHYHMLTRLIELGKTDVHLNYNTNLSMLRYKQYDLFELWSKFDKIHLNLSLDGIGERGEYIRDGLKFTEFLSNVDRVKGHDNIHYTITYTVSLFNALHIKDTFMFLHDNGYINFTQFNMILLNDPMYLNAKLLPRTIKDECIKSYNELIEILTTRTESKKVINLLNKTIKYINEDIDKKFEKDFLDFIGKIDTWRKQDFRKVFPELGDIFNEQKR